MRDDRAPWAATVNARDLLTDPVVLTDAVLPPVVFVAVDAWRGLEAAAIAALGLAVLLLAVRVVRGQRILYALSGAAGVGFSVGLALWSGSAATYFVPGVIGNLLTGLACAGSVLIGRPLTAEASRLIYQWPADWYRHPRVRPAYREVTWAWAAFYLAKAVLGAWLVQREATGALAAVRVASGLPALAVMLLFTYRYVDWRLRTTGAPPAEAFAADAGSAVDAPDTDAREAGAPDVDAGAAASDASGPQR